VKTPDFAQNPLLSGDQPLVDPAADALGYADFAKTLAQSALRGSPATGLVVGVYGEWGLGKTTILNFIEHYANADTDDDAPIVIRFNPWWFSGREDLLGRFFSEFEEAVLLRRGKRNKLRKAIGKLGEAATNSPSAWATNIGKTAMLMAAHGQPADLKSLKKDIVGALKAKPLRVIVLVDDIDRLLPSEMVDIFRMVRYVGDLPNVHYVLAFDRGVVAKALSGVTGADGERYLEKIVQAPFDLPRPTATSLREILTTRLQTVLAETDPALFEAQYWSDVLFHGVFPFIRTPRDVVRLINALAVTYPSVQNEVNPTDFVAIETLRVFAPDEYEIVRSNPTRFVGLLSVVEHMSADNKRFHESWLGESTPIEAATKAMVQRLFPSVSKVLGTNGNAPSESMLRKNRRICSEEAFECYFRYSPGRSVSRREFLDCLAADNQTLRLRLRSFLGESVNGRKTKLRQFLEMLLDDLGTHKSLGSAVLSEVCAVGDELIAKMPRDFAFETPDDIFLVFVVEKLLERLPREERIDELKAGLSRAGASTTARVATILGAQHGRHGQQANPLTERTLESNNEIDEIEQIARVRIERAALAGSLWRRPDLIRLLFDWNLLCGGSTVREAVGKWVAQDSANMVVLIVGLGLPSTSGRIMFNLKSASELIDLDHAASAVEQLLNAGEFEERNRLALTSFMDTYVSTSEGRRALQLDRKLISDVLEQTVQSGWFLNIDQVNVLFESERARIRELVNRDLLREVGVGQYLVTNKAMREMGEDANAPEELQVQALLIKRLQAAYRTSAGTAAELSQIAQELPSTTGRSTLDALQRATIALICDGDSSQFFRVQHTGARPSALTPLAGILDFPVGHLSQSRL
jgi:predicted KAP-like P-loop ATPase